MWNKLTPDNLPSPQELVLLRLRPAGCVLQPSQTDATKSLLRRGVFYGYVVAFLHCTKDGFERDVPSTFYTLAYKPTDPSPRHPFHFEPATAIEFKDVDAWMTIPDNTNT